MTKVAKRSMSAEHKAALAEGRAQGHAVRDYLELISATETRRTRSVSIEQLVAKCQSVIERLASETSAIQRLHLIQQRIDLQAQIDAASGDEAPETNAESITEQFIAVAKAYGERKGITYAAWRDVGVPAGVLSKAGITRSRS